MKSTFGYEYKVKEIKLMGLTFRTLNNLDENIDILCEYFGEADQDQTLTEEHCPYFGVLWEAGIGLSQYLENRNYRELRVLEIGCGLALPSFILERQGADVLATDFHADVEPFLKYNQQLNDSSFQYSLMNWRDQIKKVESEFGLFDLVIGSDILYESQHSKQVAKALISLLKPGGEIILSDPGRAYVQKFVSAMNELGYKEEMSIQKVKAELTQKKEEKEIFVFHYRNQK